MRELFNLVGKITLDGAQNVSGSLNKIDKQAEASAKSINKSSNSLASFATKAVPAAAAIAAVVYAVKSIAVSSLKLADTIDKTSKRMQMSVVDTQKWDYVMRNAGGSVNDLSGSMQKLQVTAYAAYTGNKEAKKLFEMLGISITDVNGNVKDTNALFNDSVNALTKVQNPTERAALAQQLFGKAAKDLLPILNQSNEAINEQKKNAEQLGQVLSEQAVKNLDDVGDSIEALTKTMQVSGAEIISNYTPAILSLVDVLSRATLAMSKFLAPMVSGMARFLAFNPSEDDINKSKINKQIKKYDRTIERQKSLGSKVSSESITQLEAERDALIQTRDGIGKKYSNQFYNPGAAKTSGVISGAMLSGDFGDNDENKKVETAAEKEREAHRKFLNDEETFSVDAKQWLRDDDARIKKVEEDKAKEAANKQFDSTGLPSQMNISDAIEQGKAFDDLQRKEKENTQNTINEYISMYSSMASTVIGIFAQMYDNKIVRIEETEQREINAIKNSQMSEGDKAAAIEKIETEADKKKRALKRKQANLDKVTGIFEIGINTAVAVMKAFSTLGPPLNFVMAAVYAALGLGQIAAVASKPIPMAKGNLVPAQNGGVNALVGEGKEDEIVFPLQTGIKMMVDELINRISSISMPSIKGFAGGAMNSISSQYQRAVELHLHIGTLVADDFGLKTLERKLSTIRISESQRTGNYELSMGAA